MIKEICSWLPHWFDGENGDTVCLRGSQEYIIFNTDCINMACQQTQKITATTITIIKWNTNKRI